MSVAPIDQTTILNMALQHLGMDRINSIDDLNPSAKVLKDFWYPAMNDTFSEHRWPFAEAQIQLELTDLTIVGWDYVYQYPINDAARVWNVYSEGAVKFKEQKQFQKKFVPSSGRLVICSNEPEAYADVTWIVEDMGLWDPKFCMAHSLKMASLACPALLGDANKSLTLMTVFNGVINEAKRIGASEDVTIPNQQTETGSIASRG